MPEQEPQTPENLFNQDLRTLDPHDLHNLAKELIAANDIQGMKRVYDFASKRRNNVSPESMDYWACEYIMADVSKVLEAQEK